MRPSTHARALCNLYLDDEEMWTEHNQKDLPFRVRIVIYDGGPKCRVQGFAIRADGSEGVIQRDVFLDVAALPIEIRLAVVTEVKRGLEQALESASFHYENALAARDHS